jgi:hypothetical protein
MGGYGVYQSFRRMVREERTDHAAEYPKPITYRQPDPQSIDFKGYLPDSPRLNESSR